MNHIIFHNHAAAAAIPNPTALHTQQTGSQANSAAPGAQYNFAEIFGAASDERNNEAATATTSTAGAPAKFVPAVAIAAPAVAQPVTAAAVAAASANPVAATVTPAVTAADATTTPPAVSSGTPGTGIMALVNAIMSGSIQATNVTDPQKLVETTPAGTDYMPSFYYASDQTANQIAQLLGGTVVQAKAFGQAAGFIEPNANFIQLPNGMTFNAADVAYYANHGASSEQQLTADLTQTINAGAAWTNYYQKGGPMPMFSTGYVGPPITGMAYPSSMIGADGNVINPAMQGLST